MSARIQAASLPNVSATTFISRVGLPNASTKSSHLSMYTHLAKLYSTSCIFTMLRALRAGEVDVAIGEDGWSWQRDGRFLAESWLVLGMRKEGD